jgi:hypothetical protein
MSFLRHEEIYRSDGRLSQSWERQPLSSLPWLIGYDEFPIGYSLAGCPPAEPASASPTGNDSPQPTLPYNDFSANGNNTLNPVSHPKGALHLGPIRKVLVAEFYLANIASKGPRKTNLRDAAPGLLRLGALGGTDAEMENFVHFSHEVVS